MRTTTLLVVLLAAVANSKSIHKRAISEFSAPGAPPSIVISDSPNNEQIKSYQTMLEGLLRQLSAIEQQSPHTYGNNPSSAELADEYQREYYTQAASDIVQKLIQYGALSAIVDAENAAFYDDADDADEEDFAEMPLVRIGQKEVAPASSGAEAEEPFTDEQAHEVLKMIIEEMMDKFFADMKNTHAFVLGVNGEEEEKEDEDYEVEEVEPLSEEETEGDDSSSSSSSSEEDEYFYGDSDEGDEFVIDTDDDAVIVVNKQVSTNLIRIPTATFVEALTKLLPTLNRPTYPTQLQKLTPLQVEDHRIYSEHGEPSLTGSGPDPRNPHVSSHSVSPIASVAPTPTADARSEYYHRAFDLGHVLLALAAGLLCMWAIAQLISMYRRREQTTAPGPAMALPPKVIPAIIPNIYATPPAVLTKPTEEKPPVYVEKPEV